MKTTADIALITQTVAKKKFRLNGHMPTKFQRVAFEHTGIAVAKIGEVDTNLADHVAG
jgi:hypothetical protein